MLGSAWQHLGGVDGVETLDDAAEPVVRAWLRSPNYRHRSCAHVIPREYLATNSWLEGRGSSLR